jgi:hypothetical protein
VTVGHGKTTDASRDGWKKIWDLAKKVSWLKNVEEESTALFYDIAASKEEHLFKCNWQSFGRHNLF